MGGFLFWERVKLALQSEQNNKPSRQRRERGLEVLKENPKVITIAYLKRFEGFNEFLKPTKDKDSTETTTLHESSTTPRETLEAAYHILRKQLIQEVLDKVKEATPRYFGY